MALASQPFAGVSGDCAESRGEQFRIEWATVLLWVAVLLPFVYSTARTGDEVEAGGFGPLDIVRGGGVVVLALFVRLTWLPVRENRDRLLALLWVFVLICAISSLWSVEPRATLLKVVPLSGTFYALSLIPRYYKSNEAVMTAASGVVHFILLSTIFGAIVAPSTAFAVAKGEDIARLGAIIPQISANPLAYVALAGLLSIALRVAPNFILKRPWLQVLLALSYVAVLLLTRTRIGVALAVLVIVLAITFGLRHRPLSSILSTLIAIPAALMLFTYTSSVTEYFIRGQNDQSFETLTGRTVIWRVALDSIAQHPVLGLGYYSGHRLGLTALPSAQLQSNLDNTWLELLVDVGVLGALPVALFVLVAVGRSARSIASSRGYRSFAGLLVVFGVLTSFVNPTLQAPSMSLVVLVVSILSLREPLTGPNNQLFDGGGEP